MGSKARPEKLDVKKQLRGQKAVSFLVEWIIYLKKEAEERGEVYEVNKSEIEKLSGISRKTIGKYVEDAVKVIDVEISIKRKDYNATVNALKSRVAKLNNENDLLRKELNALRLHHLRIYETLSNHRDSYEAARLLNGLHVEYTNSTGECPLCEECGSKELEVKTNIVNLSSKQ